MSDILIWELYKRFRSLEIESDHAKELTEALAEENHQPVSPLVVKQDKEVILVRFREKVA